MSISPAKIENDRLSCIKANGFEELKQRIKQRGYIRKNYLERGNKLVESIQKATRGIEREFGDIVTSIYVVGKVAHGQVSDDFIQKNEKSYRRGAAKRNFDLWSRYLR
jgi:F420-0:gamma-glutamyl ligase-like protein